MSAEHYVVLGAGRPRATWFADVGRWSTASAIPVEFVRCVSTDEIRARLGTGRSWSALLVDEACSGLDRDLLDAARQSGCAPIVVTSSPSPAALDRWVGLGAATVVAEPLERDALLAVLREHATPVARRAGDVLGALDAARATDAVSHGTEGRLVTVVGAGGTGTSTVAMAVAQAEAADPSNGGRVVLLDASLDASLALLHHNPDVVPGLQELVELHRTGRPDADAVRSVLWTQPDRGYDLLAGLRRHRDWTALRPRALAAAIVSMRRDHAVVVADTDADLEGEAETGSIDVEERNACARHLTRTADVVVVTGVDGPAGIHRLVRTIADVLDHGVEPERVLPLLNRAPKAPHRRAEIARAVALLLGELVPGAATASPLMVPARRDLDAVLHDGAPLPKAHWQPIGSAVAAMLQRVGASEGADGLDEPVPVRPGSLGVGGGA